MRNKNRKSATNVVDLSHKESITWEESLLRVIDDQLVGKAEAERRGYTPDDPAFGHVAALFAERETGRRNGEAKVEARVQEERARVSAARSKAGKAGAKASKAARSADPHVDAIMREVRRRLRERGDASTPSRNAIFRQVAWSHLGDNGRPILNEAAIKQRLQRGKLDGRGKYERKKREK